MRWRHLFRTARPDEDPSDELRAHLDHRVDDLVRDGMSSDEARRRARLEFGSIERYREEAREAGQLASARLTAEQIRREFLHAARRLAAAPLFTAFAALSLAAGIGVTVAIHASLASIVTVPIGGQDPDRVVMLQAISYGRTTWNGAFSLTDFRDLRAAQTSLRQIAASGLTNQALTTDRATEMTAIEAVTGPYFHLLGVTPRVGRLLIDTDDSSGASSVGVISERLWRTEFAEDPAIVGRSLRVGGHLIEIVGVAAAFGGLTNRLGGATDIWMPHTVAMRFASTLNAGAPGSRARQTLSVLGVLREGTPIEQANAEIATIGQQFDAMYPIERVVTPDGLPTPQPRGWAATTAAGLNNDLVTQQQTAIGAVVALVGLVLVAACSNLATLVLSRGAARRHEITVRRALGASRGRLVREQLAESALIGALGVFGAVVITRLLAVMLAIDLPIGTAMSIRLEPRIDGVTMMLIAGAALASLVIFGLLPALNLTREPERAVLASEAALTSTPRWKGRRLLISWQVTISTTFLLIAALAAQVVVGRTRHDSGVDIDRLALGVFSFQILRWDEARVRVSIDTLLEKARQVPGVDAVAMSSGLPFGMTGAPWAYLGTPDAPIRTGPDGIWAQSLAATPGIFGTLGVPIVTGRAFDQRDRRNTEPVAVLSERAARDVFGTTEVVGRELAMRGAVNMTDSSTSTTRRIVGIARDTDTQRIGSRDTGVIYLPMAQHYEPFLVLVARTSGDPAAIVGALGAVARNADPDLAMITSGTGPMMLATGYQLLRLVGLLALNLAGIAMILAMTGLFGVLSQLVSSRTREFGLRMALGADISQIRALVLKQGLGPVVRGITIGMLIGLAACAAVMVAREIPLADINVIAAVFVPFPLLASAFIACYLPARRAARVDPNIALRAL